VKLRDLLRLDLAALVKGRVQFAETTPWQAAGRGKSTLPAGWLPWKKRFRLFRAPANAAHLIAVTLQLKQLVVCGMPLARGLRLAAVDCPIFNEYTQLNRLADRLEAGAGLSEAMQEEPEFYPRYYMDIVAAAERSSALAEALESLEGQLRRDLEQTVRIMHRVSYVMSPLLGALFAGTTMLAIFYPVFKCMVEELGRDASQYPPLRYGKVVFEFLQTMGFSLHHAEDGGPSFMDRILDEMTRQNPLVAALGVMAGAAVGSLLGLLFLTTIKAICRWLGRVAAHVPGPSHIILLRDWSHVTAVLSHLLRAGFPLDRALDSVAASSGTTGEHSSTMMRIRDRVRQGDSLASAMASERRRMPHALSEAVAFAEHTGSLPRIFTELSCLYALRARRRLMVAMDILVPAGIVFAGALVAVISASAFSLLRVMAQILLEGA
jgi:type II secretory pathway component PulF